MQAAISFADRVDASLENMSPAEQRVARFFQENREQVLIASAASLAAQAGISDATVIRATKTLGFAGMDELRRSLAAELKEDLSPAGRLARTLGEVGDDQEAAFDVTLKIHQKALEDLRRDVSTGHFQSAIQHIVDARRVSIFGIGPSSAMADYFAIQLRRFGIDAFSLTQTGLLLADGLQRLRAGDLLITFAYSRVYRELAALLDQADRTGVASILVTDTLGGILGRRVDLVLKVARGRADMLSMHTATLGLIEALLVGIAAVRPEETLLALGQLNRLRTDLVGESMTLPTPPADA
jgi:DNA-binding MurR/RpiR family transcriptional regulator